MKLLLTTGILLSALSLPSFSQTEYNPSEAGIKVVRLTDKIYKLQCISGTYTNTIASVGEDGVLLVDTGYPQTSEPLRDALQKLGDGRVRIVINTHEHSDHIGGNGVFADDALILSHERVRQAYRGQYFALPGIDRPGAPLVVFKDRLSLYFNGEEIRLQHYPGGHTLGDVVVHFTDSKIVFVGDMVFAGCFPSADIGRGGDLKRCLENTEQIIKDYPTDALFVNGHGPDYRTDELKAYLDVGTTTSQMIQNEIGKGRSVDDIVASDLLSRWREWGKGVVSEREWVACVYQQHLKETHQLATSICQPLTEAIVSRGIEDAVELYTSLKENHPQKYNFAENELNTLGYRLLDRKKTAEAIEIFKLNVAAYPESGNVYDSLAEAYMVQGDNASAIEFYKKSLEKDPSNSNAKGMLNRLEKKKN
jgi:glyoxylase-like metal-dependent hydrolase (beta-lactamase superfamily II)